MGELQSQKGIREIAGLEKYMGGSVGKCKNIDFLRVRFLGCAFHRCKAWPFLYGCGMKCFWKCTYKQLHQNETFLEVHLQAVTSGVGRICLCSFPKNNGATLSISTSMHGNIPAL